MPRERGKPKRGPSWYNYVARQRRIRRLTQGFSTSLICQDGEHDEPPMAIVEEEILAEPIIVSPDSLLYTVLDPHDSPSANHFVPIAACTSDWATCIIKEEILSVDRPMETPPPSTPDRDLHSTCLLTPEHLELIFEMRRDMQEQLHRHTLLNNRLDILYDALLSSQSQQRCPTCAQPYVFTPHGGTHAGTGFTGSSNA